MTGWKFGTVFEMVCLRFADTVHMHMHMYIGEGGERPCESLSLRILANNDKGACFCILSWYPTRTLYPLALLPLNISLGYAVQVPERLVCSCDRRGCCVYGTVPYVFVGTTLWCTPCTECSSEWEG
jgi:hypothetical protein